MAEREGEEVGMADGGRPHSPLYDSEEEVRAKQLESVVQNIQRILSCGKTAYGSPSENGANVGKYARNPLLEEAVGNIDRIVKKIEKVTKRSSTEDEEATSRQVTPRTLKGHELRAIIALQRIGRSYKQKYRLGMQYQIVTQSNHINFLSESLSITQRKYDEAKSPESTAAYMITQADKITQLTKELQEYRRHIPQTGVPTMRGLPRRTSPPPRRNFVRTTSAGAGNRKTMSPTVPVRSTYRGK